MQLLILLVLISLLTVVFGDVVIMLAVRAGAFPTLWWLVHLLQDVIASALLESFLEAHPTLAKVVSVVVIAIIAAKLLKATSSLALAARPSDELVVAVDVLRTGLLAAVAVSVGGAALSLLPGVPFSIAGTTLVTFTLLGAGMDVFFPSLLAGAVNVVAPISTPVR